MDQTTKINHIKTKILQAIPMETADQQLLDMLVYPEMNLDRCDSILDCIININLGKESVFAFLNYQHYKVNPQKADEIAKKLNDEERELVDSFKTIKDIRAITKSAETEDIRTMFLALSKDVRTVIIKIAGIAYDIAQIHLPLTEEDKSFLKLVNEIHIPLSERLGLDKLKLAMDDNLVRLEHPTDYQKLKDHLESKHEENQQQLKFTKTKLEQILQDLNINGEITYRQKHISSIYKKIAAKYVTLEKIYDLLAMRIIVDSVEECYGVLGRIHAIYKPMPGRVKDYIANPKPNGYQSLHTTVIVENQHPMEIQIRTRAMHKASEFGIAAHWLYKERKGSKNELDKRVTWFREAIDNAKNLPPEEFVETLKSDLYGGVIFCQTPRGRVIEFPEGATAIDFAYAIHSDIGNQCVGVKINSKIQPITTILKNGDIIEVLTNSNSKGPSRDWLSIAKTNSARSKIRSFFKTELKEENVKTGKAIFDQVMKDKGFTAAELLTENYIQIVLFKLSMKAMDELYASVGSGSLTANQAIGRFISLWNKDHEAPPVIETVVHVKKNKDGVLIDGDSGMLVRYPGCCNPIEGDDIIGYISRGKGVTIHRKSCPNLKYLESERMIDATWAAKEGNSFIASIHVTADKANNNIAKFTTLITNMKINIVGFDAKDVGDNFICNLAVQVKNKEELDKVMQSIRTLRNVTQVYRSEKW